MATAGNTDLFTDIRRIVNGIAMTPSIVNDASKFVVVTYWWGYGNMNRNLARPCISFYEEMLMSVFEEIESISREEYKDGIQWNTWLDGVSNAVFTKFLEKYASERKNTNTRVLLEALKEKTAMFFAANAENAQLLMDGIMEKSKVKTDTALKKIKASFRPIILEQLVPLLQYKAPVTFETMIGEWEAQCARAGVNYMAIEYKDFAVSGGYQKAINAKPLFIEAALKACAPRAVLYIDGDMTVNSYPHIFDSEDVDFMARGWNIDPRSSPKHLRGDIFVDPYVFETSGGIMYFSQSPEARRLLAAWIAETTKKYQAGKADDRIISLIFNSLSLLAPMKIIQLPIEYLWLTMYYDDMVRDIDASRIYVEHPHCLTSEDTAASSGASGDRAAKWYSIVDEMKHPRSEILYTRVMFPSRVIADEFEPWLTYLRDDAIYNDRIGDAKLVNEKPFYVVPYETFGDRTATYDKNKENIARTPHLVARSDGMVYLNERNFTLPNVIRALVDGQTVLYEPEMTDLRIDSAMNDLLKDSRKNRLELVFADASPTYDPADMLLYMIDLNNKILIRPGNPLLLTMFMLMRDIGELREVFRQNYQFLSRIRVHSLKRKAGPLAVFGGARARRGVGREKNTEAALELLYGGARRQTARRRRVVRRTRRAR
jgi:hypothetical protein